MKILVLSDIHSSDRARNMLNDDVVKYSPDLVVISGDLTHFGPTSFAEELVGSIPIRTLAIPGNCDPPEVLAFLEGGGFSIHGKIVKIGGFNFVGFGGSNVTPFKTLMEFSENHIYKSLDEKMVRRAIMITHVPPRGYVDSSGGGVHFGSDAVARIVEKYDPRMVISGHIHEGRGIVRENNIVYLNSGPAMRGHRAIVELDGEKIDADLLG